jgi:thiamine-phosphate pyrophosphorylase
VSADPAPLKLAPLYAICDEEVCERFRIPLVDLAGAYLRGGVRLVQIRAKRAGSAWFLQAARAIVALAREAGATVVVNDRADVALLSGASGVHVGQDDLAPSAVRRVVGDQVIVGLSTHTLEQLEAAAAAPVDYLAIGPVFPTGTKTTGYEAVGLEMVRRAKAVAGERPLVAIGGITLATAPDVIAAGAASVAVIADLVSTGDPTVRARAFVDRLGSGPTV